MDYGNTCADARYFFFSFLSTGVVQQIGETQVVLATMVSGFCLYVCFVFVLLCLLRVALGGPEHTLACLVTSGEGSGCSPCDARAGSSLPEIWIFGFWFSG